MEVIKVFLGCSFILIGAIVPAVLSRLTVTASIQKCAGICGSPPADPVQTLGGILVLVLMMGLFAYGVVLLIQGVVLIFRGVPTR